MYIVTGIGGVISAPAIQGSVVSRPTFSWGQTINSSVWRIRDLRSHGYPQSETSPWFICRSRPRKGHSREKVRTGYRRDSKIDRASQIAVEKEVQNAALHYVTCYVAATASILLNRYISSFFYMICFNLLQNHWERCIAWLFFSPRFEVRWTTRMGAWPELQLQMEETEKGADDGILKI